MPTPSESQILAAIAGRLADAGVVTWTTTGEYPDPAPLPVATYGVLPDRPDQAVAINLYNRDPDPNTTQWNPRVWFQLRYRADSYSAVLALAETGFRALHTDFPATWPGSVNTLGCWRDLTAPPEQDLNGRWMRADSYQLRLNP